jgi:hypothetical protein
MIVKGVIAAFPGCMLGVSEYSFVFIKFYTFEACTELLYVLSFTVVIYSSQDGLLLLRF